jgi:hypothetical protein
MPSKLPAVVNAWAKSAFDRLFSRHRRARRPGRNTPWPGRRERLIVPIPASAGCDLDPDLHQLYCVARVHMWVIGERLGVVEPTSEAARRALDWLAMGGFRSDQYCAARDCGRWSKATTLARIDAMIADLQRADGDRRILAALIDERAATWRAA